MRLKTGFERRKRKNEMIGKEIPYHFTFYMEY